MHGIAGASGIPNDDRRGVMSSLYSCDSCPHGILAGKPLLARSLSVAGPRTFHSVLHFALHALSQILHTSVLIWPGLNVCCNLHFRPSTYA